MNGEKRYFLSPKIYQKALGNKILLFNPDAFGNPILIREDVGTLLRNCSKGVSEKQLFASMPSSMSEEDKEVFLAFLKKYHIIQSTAVPDQIMTPSSSHKGDLSVWFHITNDCNLRCPYCFVKKSKDSLEKAKIDSFVTSLLTSASQRGHDKITIKFAGGEPLLRTDLIKYAIDKVEQKKGDKLQVTYAVLSNGTQMDEGKASFLKEKRIGISISLDGYGDIHDKTRKDIEGKGSFKIIEKNIELLKNNGIRPFILATISEETIDFLPQLTRWLLDKELYSRYSFIKDFAYSLSGYNRFCRKIIIAMQKSIEEIKRHPFGPSFVLNWNIADLSFTFPLRRQPCGIGLSHLVVNHRGELTLCPMTLDNPIGTVEKDILKQYEKFESKYKQEKPIDPCCQRCQWHRVCGTGCPILNEALQTHPNKRSPFCRAYRRLIPDCIDTYGWALQQLSSSKETC